ncbi:MAG: hypothetical protein R3E76_04440 [Planctomycetota bacterium]
MTRKATALLALFLLSMTVIGCSFGTGANETGKKWIALIEKHKAALQEGKFDAAAFKTEATPIAEELKKKRDPDQKKVLMTEKVLEDFKRVSKEFETLLAQKGTPEQQQAYLDVLDIWIASDTPADNASANGE